MTVEQTEKSYRVGVLFGGRSGEHEVSLASAQNVMEALTQAGHQVLPLGITREGRWLINQDPMGQLKSSVAQLTNANPLPTGEVVTKVKSAPERGWELMPAHESAALSTIDVLFPVLHGPYGEDGTIQGLLEMLDMPYVGCGVLASAVAMDKAIAKKLFAAEGLPQAPHQVLMRDHWQRDGSELIGHIADKMGYPLFVKPANLGSSVGVSKAQNQQEFEEAVELAARYDRKLIIEEAIPNAREIEVSVLGISHADSHGPMASLPGEIIPGQEFYDYAAKYEDESSQLLIPAPLSEPQTSQVRQMALQAFEAIDGSGLARVDFLMNRETEVIYLNELNTMPGFTQISMYPKLWEASGITYPELVDRLIHLALTRHHDRKQNESNR
ncbi:MAG: D-alanine--D-alanine ligase family protein [Chloroflexota bacterium]